MMWDDNGIWGHGASWGAAGWLMWIGMIALIVAAVVLVVFLIRAMTQQQAPVVASGPHPRLAAYDPPHTAGSAAAPATQHADAASIAEPPRDIVQRRYAAGEIDREEYLQKLADL
jgi:uncharacterized membrane protein